MRRLILIVTMCLLPIQFSWAAVAAVSAHAVHVDAGGHLGHHDGHHDHDLVSSQVASSDAASSDATADTTAVVPDDGSTCHSHGHSHSSDLVSPAWVLAMPDAGSSLAAHRMRHIPDAHPDELLRPPLALLA